MSTRRVPPSGGRLLTSGEVGDLFHVNRKTVGEWAKTGKISSFRTIGGHRRFREAEVWALLEGAPAPWAGAE